MRITYVTMQFPVPSETFASLDIQALQKQGHEVTVYGLRPNHKNHKELIKQRGHDHLLINNFDLIAFINGIKLLILHPLMYFSLLYWIVKNTAKTPKHFIKSLFLLPSVTGHFQGILIQKPDVVHLFWGHYPAMLGFLVKRFMPDIVVSQFLGAHDLLVNYPGSVELAKNIDLIFTHSYSNLPILNKIGISSTKVNVVFRGTKLVKNTNPIIDKFDKIEAPLFLTAARLIKEKGVGDVIRIFSDIVVKYPNAKLIIAGDGPYRANLSQMAKKSFCENNIEFIGHVNQNDLIKKMSKTHFFLLMSRYSSERLPNVIKEAMYQQCVVITTNSEGIDELINDGVTGFIVNKGDYSVGVEKVIFCLENPNFSRIIADKAKVFIKENFDVDNTMNVYSNMWLAALKDKGIFL